MDITVLEQERILALKVQLKEWEHEFAKTHNGQKPSKADIKSDSIISAKYKKYNELREPPKPTKKSSPDPADAKRRHNAGPEKLTAGADVKNIRRSKEMSTVTAAPAGGLFTPKSKRIGREQPHVPAKETSPTLGSSPVMFRPPVVLVQDETPQREGKLRGLFETWGGLPTPSPVVFADRPNKRLQVAVTPCKSSSKDSLAHLGLTPSSFKTPKRKRKRSEIFDPDVDVSSSDEETPLKATPQTRSYDPEFETPAFLKRRKVDFEQLDPDATPATFKPSFVMRGKPLSKLIQEYRTMKEEQLEEQLDADEAAMNEVEAEQAARAAGKVIVEDNRTPVPESQLNSSADLGEQPSSNPQINVWKKRGAKRQTRRAVLRPVKNNPNAHAASNGRDVKGTREDRSLSSKVVSSIKELSKSKSGKKQMSDNVVNDSSDDADGQGESGAEYGRDVHDDDDSDGDNEDTKPPQKRVRPAKDKENDTIDAKTDGKGKKRSAMRKAVNKVAAAAAHPNFKSLKLRNKNSKGKGGGGRWFNRRR